VRRRVLLPGILAASLVLAGAWAAQEQALRVDVGRVGSADSTNDVEAGFLDLAAAWRGRSIARWASRTE